jgi:hypothetical protein
MHQVSSCLVLAMLLLPGAYASAQEKPADKIVEQGAQPPTQGHSPSAPDHMTPVTPEAQPKAPLADLSKPAAVGPAQAGTAGSIPSDAPPGSTPQTMPSTISAANAELDKLPITALQFPLNDEQKSLIEKSVAEAPETQTKADLKGISVADFLPTEVPITEFPAEVTGQFPSAGRYKYVKSESTIWIVDPTLLAVVGEIKH